jgi:1-acyl-sn-glycerol-3-phosphate acyltransferase
MKRRDAETTPEVNQSIGRSRRSVEADTAIQAIRVLVAALIRLGLRIYNRFEITGQENLRTNRSLVIVANHSSHLDTPCLLSALPLSSLSRVFPVAAEDYFFHKAARRWVASILFNAVPFTRQTHVRHSLSVCSDLLGEPGTALIVFPEGTRSRTGELCEFKDGIGALVAGRDVTLVPCYLQGAARAWPKGSRLPRPFKVRLIVGSPRCYSSHSLARTDINAIASDLHRAVAALERSHEGH